MTYDFVKFSNIYIMLLFTEYQFSNIYIMLLFTEYQIIKYFLAMLCQNVVPQNKMI